jgi:hypothetical protein
MTSSDATPESAAAAQAPPEATVTEPDPPEHAVAQKVAQEQEDAPEAGAPEIAPSGVPAAGPVRPEQAREDTDAGWGEYPERADDRLYRDRPPHWDDF